MNDIPPRTDSDPPLSASDRHNFWVSAWYLIVVRIGWIFKTETVIVPAFLDSLGGSAALRGWLPVLGRLGQSLPQFLYAHRVHRLPRKKWALVSTTAFQGLPWAILSIVIVWRGPSSSRSLVWLFLAIYTIFFVANGMNLLVMGILQGKLIPVRQRGRLLAVSSFWGCALAIVAAGVSLSRWLEMGQVGYAWIFGATTFFFVVSAGLAGALDEPPDPHVAEGSSFGAFLAGSGRLLAGDANFRRLIVVVTLYYMVLILFPHYAAYGTQELKIAETSAGGFALWVIVQNAMNGLSSLFIGPLADRRGNRIALCVLTVLAGLTPLVAIGLSLCPAALARNLYWAVFALLGFTPVSQRIISNYCLEICPVQQHAQYLGTLNLFQGLPLLAGPVVGYLIDVTSFNAVFAVGAGTIFLGALLAQGLVEPRGAG